jgi:predicted transcriptional regulator
LLERPELARIELRRDLLERLDALAAHLGLSRTAALERALAELASSDRAWMAPPDSRSWPVGDD